MKNNFATILIVAVAFLFVMSHLQSCNPFEINECKDVFCGDQGSCFDGNCVCEHNWTGDSCQINLCPDTWECQNGGICENGICIGCASGYLGDTCEILLRGIYVDTFDVSDICTQANDTLPPNEYTVVINGAADSLLYIEIMNLHNDLTGDVRAKVTESGMTIAQQSVQGAGALFYDVEGFSTVHDSTSFVLNYFVTDTSANIVDTCVATFTVP